ncbi:MAG: NADPH-dependent 2,4-dienoyl-CoA reductase [Pseudomonadota bacterium]|nr:NADPH-dependent 2,4-dienoyl-CoA reductase [Pseudomonadota bacterium]
MNHAYPHLLAPLALGPVQLRNRIMMGSMHTGLEEARGGLRGLAAFYAERARGGVALIVTGGIGISEEGALAVGARLMCRPADVAPHREVTDAVHAEGGRIALQLIHAGRYAYNPRQVAPSAIQAPINPFTPRALSSAEVDRTADDFANAAALAREAGYDGVEIMGSEGYLLNQFLAPRTNRRDDEWGGDAERRMRLPVEVVRRVRAAVGEDCIVIYRQSMLDLVQDGSTGEEIIALARQVEAAGASLINTGIGWHEARVPTIATLVPRGAFAWATARVKAAVGLPVIVSNRINDPALAEALLAAGEADMVSMARPLLADADFARKAAAGTPAAIDTCIACNQACLDHTFSGKMTSCLVNPRACHELELTYPPTTAPRRLAVVGGGPAGLACAHVAALRGHAVTLFEAQPRLGGQFVMAARIPGKAEYAETIRYFEHELARLQVDVRLGQRATAAELAGFDHVVLATGVVPRTPALPGVDHPSVLSYQQVLGEGVEVGGRVALIGGGGIGVDTAHFLADAPAHEAQAEAAFCADWGVSRDLQVRGGLTTPQPSPGARQIWLCQRSAGKVGRYLGKTTAWAHRALLAKRGVQILTEVQYEGVDDAGLHLRVGETPRLLPVDHIVLCAGQESEQSLRAPLEAAGVAVTVIGGAERAAELDAKRAIDQACRLAATL